jgi:enamine deaminase RidA (YjgF/YER057c/UK114 family)
MTSLFPLLPAWLQLAQPTAAWHRMRDPVEGGPMRRTVSSGGPFEDAYGYSRAVRVGGHIHVSGTTARPPHLDGADAYQQALAALRIIEAALDESGSSLSSVVRTVTYVTDIGDADLVAQAHREILGQVRPAATLVEVSRLLDPRMKVEIEVYAIEPD